MADETHSNAIPVWFNGTQRWMTGVTKRTTCDDVIYALLVNAGLQETVSTDRYAIFEKWREVERPLSARVKILKIWHFWGEEQPNVQLSMRSLDDYFLPGEGSLYMRSRRRHKRTSRNRDIGSNRCRCHNRRACTECFRLRGLAQLVRMVVEQERRIREVRGRIEHTDRLINRHEAKIHQHRVHHNGLDYVEKSYLNGRDSESSTNSDNSNNTDLDLKDISAIFRKSSVHELEEIVRMSENMVNVESQLALEQCKIVEMNKEFEDLAQKMGIQLADEESNSDLNEAKVEMVRAVTAYVINEYNEREIDRRLEQCHRDMEAKTKYLEDLQKELSYLENRTENTNSRDFLQITRINPSNSPSTRPSAHPSLVQNYISPPELKYHHPVSELSIFSSSGTMLQNPPTDRETAEQSRHQCINSHNQRVGSAEESGQNLSPRCGSKTVSTYIPFSDLSKDKDFECNVLTLNAPSRESRSTSKTSDKRLPLRLFNRSRSAERSYGAHLESSPDVNTFKASLQNSQIQINNRINAYNDRVSHKSRQIVSQCSSDMSRKSKGESGAIQSDCVDTFDNLKVDRLHPGISPLTGDPQFDKPVPSFSLIGSHNKADSSKRNTENRLSPVKESYFASKNRKSNSSNEFQNHNIDLSYKTKNSSSSVSQNYESMPGLLETGSLHLEPLSPPTNIWFRLQDEQPSKGCYSIQTSSKINVQMSTEKTRQAEFENPAEEIAHRDMFLLNTQHNHFRPCGEEFDTIEYADQLAKLPLFNHYSRELIQNPSHRSSPLDEAILPNSCKTGDLFNVNKHTSSTEKVIFQPSPKTTTPKHQTEQRTTFNHAASTTGYIHNANQCIQDKTILEIRKMMSTGNTITNTNMEVTMPDTCTDSSANQYENRGALFQIVSNKINQSKSKYDLSKNVMSTIPFSQPNDIFPHQLLSSTTMDSPTDYIQVARKTTKQPAYRCTNIDQSNVSYDTNSNFKTANNSKRVNQSSSVSWDKNKMNRPTYTTKNVGQPSVSWDTNTNNQSAYTIKNVGQHSLSWDSNKNNQSTCDSKNVGQPSVPWDTNMINQSAYSSKNVGQPSVSWGININNQAAYTSNNGHQSEHFSLGPHPSSLPENDPLGILALPSRESQCPPLKLQKCDIYLSPETRDPVQNLYNCETFNNNKRNNLSSSDIFHNSRNQSTARMGCSIMKNLQTNSPEVHQDGNNQVSLKRECGDFLYARDICENIVSAKDQHKSSKVKMESTERDTVVGDRTQIDDVNDSTSDTGLSSMHSDEIGNTETLV